MNPIDAQHLRRVLWSFQFVKSFSTLYFLLISWETLIVTDVHMQFNGIWNHDKFKSHFNLLDTIITQNFLTSSNLTLYRME